MPEYDGTSGADTINQVALNISGGPINGEGGDDLITVTDALAIGGPGNDTITGTIVGSGVAYWTSPSGVTVDLSKGVASDGFGGTDKLVGITQVQDSPNSDSIKGSFANETFWLSGGDNTVDGGGGIDTVVYGAKPGEISISYDPSSQAIRVQKHFSNGITGTDTLKGVSTIQFFDPTSGPPAVIYLDNYLPSGVSALDNRLPNGTSVFSTKLSSTTLNLANGVIFGTIAVGDFNGDGKPDLLVSTLNWSGLTSTPLFVLAGDGAGGFADQTSTIFGGAAPSAGFANRDLVGDFNGDGRADVFIVDQGSDTGLVPGGQDKLLLSTGSAGMSIASGNLPQLTLFNHGGAVGDINGDGKLDAVAFTLNANSPNLGGPAIQLYINDGTGHFTLDVADLPAAYQSTGFNKGSTGGALIDVNNDGHPDLIVGTWTNTGLPSQIFLNDGHGSFAHSAPIALPASGVSNETVLQVVPIDLNGDGFQDLMLAITDGSTNSADYYKVPYIQLLVNDGTGHFQDETQSRLLQDLRTPTGTVSDTPAVYFSLYSVDINGDGYKDIVADGRDASVLFVNDGTGHFTRLPILLPALATPLVDPHTGSAFAFAVSEGSAISVIKDDLPTGYGVTSGLVIHATDALDSIQGGIANDTITATSGQTYLRGAAGDDSISGGSGFDDINGNQGNDTEHGNGGDDWVVGGKDSDLLFGDAGNDIVWGNLGNDTLDGGDGNDQVRGGQGDDSISGGAGDDYVSGDRGNDTISGGPGADLFHSFSGAGIDRVLDFNASEGDRVMLDPGTTYTASQVGADTVIDMGNGDQMILVGVQLSSLPAGWIFLG
jgi:Ca2+-binding RTX toxin-like protein